ncbi:MAG TPA: hypothetical protein VLB01_03470 [Thermodesulfobacteriota bacterium]|nr:hypothetical protein [Thermodesulfobacteriota bacterium]
MAKEPRENIGAKIRNAFVGTVKSAGDVVGSTIELTRKTTVTTLQGVRDVVKETSGLATDTMIGVIRAANEVGTELGSTTKGS